MLNERKLLKIEVEMYQIDHGEVGTIQKPFPGVTGLLLLLSSSRRAWQSHVVVTNGPSDTNTINEVKTD